MAKVKYEIVEISLVSATPRSQRDLQEFLFGRNFKTMDDRYFKLRTDKFPLWQIDEIASIRLKYEGKELYSTSEDIAEKDASWDSLELSYLLSALPRKFIKEFIDEVVAIFTEFNLALSLDEKPITTNDLSHMMNNLADELETEMGEAGSEIVAILIQMQYS